LTPVKPDISILRRMTAAWAWNLFSLCDFP
jgi:hypothetical protein